MIVREKDRLILVIMEDGENLVENLSKLKERFTAVSFITVITALGMLKNVKMGYWNGREYDIHPTKEPSELLGISGIITPNTEPFFHFHIILGTKSGNVVGGHLLEADVCNTLEMVLYKGDFDVVRKPIGNLKLLRPKED